MNWTAHLTVATVVERAGRYLMVYERSEDAREVYNQPAGHVEAGETLIAAAQRETLEETAWEVTIESLIGVYVYTPESHPERTYYRFCFAAQALRQHARSLDTGIIRADWLTLDEIRQQSEHLRSPMVLHCIEDALVKPRYPLDLLRDPVVRS